MRYRLRTLLILLSVVPYSIAGGSAKSVDSHEKASQIAIEKPAQVAVPQNAWIYVSSDANDIVIVDGRGNPDAFVEFSSHLPIKPHVARELVDKWDKKHQYGGTVGEFEGIVNDEYIISPRDALHKKGFVLCGFRVHVKTGAVRYVQLKDLATEHGGRFAKGYIPEGEVSKYLVGRKSGSQRQE